MCCIGRKRGANHHYILVKDNNNINFKGHYVECWMSLAHYAAVQQVAAASQEFEFNHHLDSFQIFWGLENFFSHSSHYLLV